MKRLRSTTMAFVLLAVAGCAGGVGPATAPPTVNVTGKWSGTWQALNTAQGSGMIELTLKQSASTVTGDLLVTGAPTDPSGYTQGVVSGNEVRIIQPSNMTGSLTVKDDTMNGIVGGVIQARVTLNRQK